MEGAGLGVAVAADCAGTSDLEINGTEYDFYLDECTTRTLIDALNEGEDATAICAIVAGALAAAPVAVPCAVVSGLLGIAASTLDAADAQDGDQGIVAQFDWGGQDVTFESIVPTIWAQ
jgi:hypothetical protein